MLSYSAYVVLLADYSFNINGPQRVHAALGRGALDRLLLDSVVAKIALLLPGALVFTVLLAWTGRVSPLAIGMAVLLPIATTLTPRWAVYGLSRLHLFLAVSALARVSWLIVVVALVKTPDDLILLVGLSVVTQVFILACCYTAIWPRDRSQLRPSLRGGVAILSEDFKLFASSASLGATKDLGLALLAVTAPISSISIYAVADRVRVALLGLTAPVTQALFLLSAKSAANRGDALDVLRFANVLILSAVTVGSLVVYFSAGTIIDALAGPHFSAAVGPLQVICFIPPLATLNSIIGTNTLLVSGRQSAYAGAQLATAAIAAPTALAAVVLAGAAGAAFAAVFAEALLSVITVVIALRSGLIARAFPLPGGR
ncbi:MAG: hypothetical protein J0J13_14250 [Devosia sp.]|nr:hypothetical protein [Devosia sp.]